MRIDILLSAPVYALLDNVKQDLKGGQGPGLMFLHRGFPCILVRLQKINDSDQKTDTYNVFSFMANGMIYNPALFDNIIACIIEEAYSNTITKMETYTDQEELVTFLEEWMEK